VKLTPLNITLACILVWYISEYGKGNGQYISLGWLMALLVMIILIDQAFRLMFKHMKTLWYVQVGFVLLVSVLILVLKVI